METLATVTEQPVTLGQAARSYAKHGLHVFPLQPMSKIPMKGSRGCKDATTDAEQITAWWTATPDANIGIATGHLVDVIDIDGPIGNVSLARELLVNPTQDDPFKPIPVIGTVSTPRPGGRHLYVRTTGRGNGANLAPGIDFRGLGGYVVAPPSTNEQGRYVWVRPIEVGEL